MTGNSVEKQYCYEAVKQKKKAILCNSQMCLHVVLPILSWLLPVGITRRQRFYVSVSFFSRGMKFYSDMTKFLCYS